MNSVLKLDQILDELFDAVYVVDLERRITLWNRAAEELSGFSREEVIGTCCCDNILMHVAEDGRRNDRWRNPRR